jgi:hypothetical protein
MFIPTDLLVGSHHYLSVNCDDDAWLIEAAIAGRVGSACNPTVSEWSLPDDYAIRPLHWIHIWGLGPVTACEQHS